MASGYAIQIQNEIDVVKQKINTVLGKLYSSNYVLMDCAMWCTTSEYDVLEKINVLMDEYQSIVENMRTSLWGENYWTPIINEFNSFAKNINQLFDHFEMEANNVSLFENTSFGQINEKLYQQITKGNTPYLGTIYGINNSLEAKNYVGVLNHGYDHLHYSLWASAFYPTTTLEYFMKCKQSYYRLSRYFNMDVLCAELYLYHQVKKQILIDETLDFYFNNTKILKQQADLDILSSALQWMNNQEGLKKVLVYMNDKGFTLSNLRRKKLNELKTMRFKPTFDIRSGNERIDNQIQAFILSITTHYVNSFAESNGLNALSPISYECALKNNKVLNDTAFSNLQAIRYLNGDRLIPQRDKLTEYDLARLQKIYDDFAAFNSKNQTLKMPSYYLEGKKINDDYFREDNFRAYDNKNLVLEMNRINDIFKYDFECFNEKKWNQLWTYDARWLIKYAMNLAIGANYKVNADYQGTTETLFKEVKALVYRLVRYFNIHMFICELEFIVNKQGKQLIQFQIDSYLKNDDLYKCQDDLDALSSFLEYHDLNDEEQKVYQYMIDHKMYLNNYKANRLYYLNNHSEDAPKTFVVNKQNQLHFDVSSIDWRENEVNDFFKELELSKKTLDYSLAVSLQDHDLVIPVGMKLESLATICEVLNSSLYNEYGDEEVHANVCNATILSDVNEEIEGFVIDISECKNMKLFVHLMKIGKKLNICFYTLYVPNGHDLISQKAQLMSMIKRVSPSLSLWEKSVKNSTLLVLQYMLNRNQNNHMKNLQQEDEF